MKAIKISITAITIFGSVIAASAQNADDIIKNHEKAIGGKESWNKVKTMKMSGSMSVQGMDIAINENLVIDKAMRMDFSVMGMTGFQIVTKKDGYMMEPGTTKLDTLKPDMLKEAQKQLNVSKNQMFDYKEEGGKAEYAGKDSVNDALCFKVKFTDKEGNESTSYFDANTYYLLRTETKIKQDDQEQEMAMSYKDYKKLPEGVVMPMSITSPAGEIVFKTIEINNPVDEKIFDPSVSASK